MNKHRGRVGRCEPRVGRFGAEVEKVSEHGTKTPCEGICGDLCGGEPTSLLPERFHSVVVSQYRKIAHLKKSRISP